MNLFVNIGFKGLKRDVKNKKRKLALYMYM